MAEQERAEARWSSAWDTPATPGVSPVFATRRVSYFETGKPIAIDQIDAGAGERVRVHDIQVRPATADNFNDEAPVIGIVILLLIANGE